jgi:hypothetical protein
MVTATEPALIEDVIRPVRELLVVLIFLAATARVALRLRRASRLMRRTLRPVLGAATVRLAGFAGLVSLRRMAPESDFVAAWMWSLPLGVPLLAGAFLVGLVRRKLFVASAGQRLAARLADHPRPEHLRTALAETFDDPSLEIVYRVDDQARWPDARDVPTPAPRDGADRCLTEIPRR